MLLPVETDAETVCSLGCAFDGACVRFRRATTSARRPTYPSARGSAAAASPCPWSIPLFWSICRRRPPVSWPFTPHTPSTAGLSTTSSYLPTRLAWQVRRFLRGRRGGEPGSDSELREEREGKRLLVCHHPPTTTVPAKPSCYWIFWIVFYN